MAFAKTLESFLKDKAGLNIWRDGCMPGAAPVADTILRNIKNSRAVLLVLSKHARSSGWVQAELRRAIEEKNTTNGRFRIIPIILDGDVVPDGVSDQKCLANQNRELSLEFGFDVLAAFYPFQDSRTIGSSVDVFVSRSWREEEAQKPDAICRKLIRSGFRLIGDSKDWKHFDGASRIKEIIESCGAMVAIVPFRPYEPPKTSKYILQEIDIALSLGVPCLVIADEEVPIDEAIAGRAIDRRVMRTSELDGDMKYAMLASSLREGWRQPKREHYGFFATDFKVNTERGSRSVAIAERVTGMRCLTGRDFQSSGAQEEIIRRISDALYFVGDLSNLNVSRGNVLVEIGIALGARVQTNIVCLKSNGRPHDEIFMFKGREIKYSSDDPEFVAKVHSICRRYRRRIFNAELEEAGLLN